MKNGMQKRAEKAAAWIAEGGGEASPYVKVEGEEFFSFSTRGLDFRYTGHGWRYDDDPWNERNLSRVEYEEGVHVILSCPRHGIPRWYPYGTVPFEMPPMARYSGKAMACAYCSEPATFNGNVGSSYNGTPLPTPLCEHCGRVRFRLPASVHAARPLRHPRYTKKDLRRATEDFLATVREFNPECHKCVTLVSHGCGYGNITHAMLRRTYQL